MSQAKPAQTLVQCDFDGTITHEDVSFLLLDAFADGDWRKMQPEYDAGKISVAKFSTRAFSMIKADKQTLLDFIVDKVKIRAGLFELLSYCKERGFQFVVVSNGMDFYVESILGELGINNIEVFAARTEFNPEGIRVKYIGPDGNQLQDGFKESYTRLFIGRGYRVIYVGNGASDIYPARQAHHTFATGTLIKTCEQEKVDCIPFMDLNEVVRGLELLDKNP